MTTNAIEMALWRMVTDTQAAAQFLAAPDDFLADFRLDAAERDLLRQMEVGQLAAREVNPMLLWMGFQVAYGRGCFAQYMERIKARSEGT